MFPKQFEPTVLKCNIFETNVECRMQISTSVLSTGSLKIEICLEPGSFFNRNAFGAYKHNFAINILENTKIAKDLEVGTLQENMFEINTALQNFERKPCAHVNMR